MIAGAIRQMLAHGQFITHSLKMFTKREYDAVEQLRQLIFNVCDERLNEWLDAQLVNQSCTTSTTLKEAMVVALATLNSDPKPRSGRVSRVNQHVYSSVRITDGGWPNRDCWPAIHRSPQFIEMFASGVATDVLRVGWLDIAKLA